MGKWEEPRIGVEYCSWVVQVRFRARIGTECPYMRQHRHWESEGEASTKFARLERMPPNIRGKIWGREIIDRLPKQIEMGTEWEGPESVKEAEGMARRKGTGLTTTNREYLQFMFMSQWMKGLARNESSAKTTCVTLEKILCLSKTHAAHLRK